LEDREYDDEIEKVEEEYNVCDQELEKQQALCNNLKEAINALIEERATIESMISFIPTEVIDIVNTREAIWKKTISLHYALRNMSEKKEELKEKKALIVEINKFIKGFDIKDLKGKEEEIDRLRKWLSVLKEDIEQIDRKGKLLDGIPCGDSFLGCKFIRDAAVAVSSKPEIEKEIAGSEEEYSALEPTKVEKDIKGYEALAKKKEQTAKAITTIQLLIARNKNTIQRLEVELEELRAIEINYEENKEAIENLESLIKTKKVIEKKLRNDRGELEECDEEILSLNREIGSLQQAIQNIKEQKSEYHELREEYAAYDLYMRCMHPNGIAYDVIKKKLPVINIEIAKILTNLTTFEVLFEENGNRLDILIKHPKHDPRPLAMASGAEKTMAAMAIRLAFLAVSNLPTSDVIILDEPATSLDEEHLQAFVNMLDMIKSYFRTILIISHLDGLKDIVDMTIDISKKNGYSFVNQ
jgi:DNA repair exonuclease SbcCD ATPase subunit